MKLGSVTMLDKCAAGVKLPKSGQCPECGASSGEPCYKKSRQDAELLASLQAETEQLRATINDLLVCGNHIALYRKDNWPGYVLGGLTRAQQCENALRTLGATQDYDLWCCWSGMMQARDSLTSGMGTE